MALHGDDKCLFAVTPRGHKLTSINGEYIIPDRLYNVVYDTYDLKKNHVLQQWAAENALLNPQVMAHAHDGVAEGGGNVSVRTIHAPAPAWGADGPAATWMPDPDPFLGSSTRPAGFRAAFTLEPGRHGPWCTVGVSETTRKERAGIFSCPVGTQNDVSLATVLNCRSNVDL